jgi:ornithine cyclodeaminase/alanine dehydrogenase-like protein (mu-crystallin family)
VPVSHTGTPTFKQAERAFRSVLLDAKTEQTSHNGDIGRSVEADRLGRDDVAELGRFLLGEGEGRGVDHEIMVFDSTGLAVQDLAVAVAVTERWRAEPGAAAFNEVVDVRTG